MIPMPVNSKVDGGDPCLRDLWRVAQRLSTREPPTLLGEAQQLILVVTPDWDTVQGHCDASNGPPPVSDWRPVGEVGTVVVGKNGIAWDPLDTPVVPGPTKAEGDGRSPAGVFPLGKAFGFATAAEASWLKLPYLPIVEGIECVDDPASEVYNQIVDRRAVRSPDWTSAERMREVGEAYRWGVVVNYNMPAVAGRGSCIFLHVGGEGGRGTAGCTAMASGFLREVMAWIRTESRASARAAAANGLRGLASALVAALSSGAPFLHLHLAAAVREADFVHQLVDRGRRPRPLPLNTFSPSSGFGTVAGSKPVRGRARR